MKLNSEHDRRNITVKIERKNKSKIDGIELSTTLYDSEKNLKKKNKKN